MNGRSAAIAGLHTLLLCLSSVALADSLASTQPTALHWLTSLDTAFLQIKSPDQSIFVFAGSREDRASRLAFDAVQSKLTPDDANRWIFVSLDVADSRTAIESLGIATVPAARILSPSGSTLSHYDGPFDTVDFPRWLDTNRRRAPASSTDTASQQTNLNDLDSPDAARRQAAIRTLAADRQAAPAVISLLFNGKMSARLAALDLLEQWGAPVQNVDPWNNSTLTPALHNKLQSWVSSAIATPTPQPTPTAQAAIELDAMLAAKTGADARAIREQLLRFGPALLPTIYLRLKPTSDDTAHERLTALRYRLVAPERLADAWPSGFDRLASPDPFIRRAAVTELSQLAQQDTVRLLTELFSDDDPFVRAQSLTILRSVGGADTNAALMNLLKDPDPNVRAAVLKTLAENPDASLSANLIAYVKTEKDTDLVVHCIHLLQQLPGDETIHCFLQLLEHPQWRVRAEICQAVRQMQKNNPSSDPNQMAPMVVALMKHLDDRDEFVVSQAAIALVEFKLASANAAVLKAIDRHPDLVVDLMGELRLNQELGPLILPAIRKLVHNPSPQLRASSIRAVCKITAADAGDEINIGLNDSDPSVRRAAALGFLDCIQEMLETFGNNQPHPNKQLFVTNVQAGSGRPQWITDLKGQFARSLTGPDEQIRIASAIGLCTLNRADEAWPVLQKSMASPGAAATEASALPWLPWDRRKDLFQHLAAVTPNGQFSELVANLTIISDPRAAPLLWDLLKDDRHSDLLNQVNWTLDACYSTDDAGADHKQAITDAKAMLEGHSDLQKTEAILLLCKLTPTDVIDPAKKIALNTKASAPLRADAIQACLLVSPKSSAQTLAVQSLSDPALRKPALTYLALGQSAITTFHDEIVVSPPTNVGLFAFFGGGDPTPTKPRRIDVPSGLQAAMLHGLLADPDDDIAAYAGYLLALLGDRSGFDSVVAAARSHGLDGDWGALLYRAITKLNDDSKTPILEEIYNAMNHQNTSAISEFYWTIRAMTGPNILKLRKKIRDEIGVQNLN